MSGWVVLVGTLGGAGIGIAGTLGAQLLSNKAEQERNRLLKQDSQRRELGAQIDVLIRAAQLVEEAATKHRDEWVPKGSAAAEMWVAYKSLSLRAAEPLRAAAATYCDELNGCLWQPTEIEPWQRVRAAQQDFLAEAAEAVRLR